MRKAKVLRAREVAAVAMVGLAILVAGCSKPQAQSQARPAVPVVAADAVQTAVPVQVQGIGTVEAYSTVPVKTMVAGELVKVHFTEGQDVRKGEVLFTIDRRPFETALAQAEAQLARNTAAAKQARANLARDTAQLENARIELKRYEEMVKQGIIAQQQYDSVRTNAEALEASVNASRAAIENAEAAVKADQAAIARARLELSYSTVEAPLSGRTGSLAVHQGSIVKGNDTVLVTINQVQPIYVNFPVPERYLSEIKRQSANRQLRIEARITGEEDRPEHGALTFLDNTVDTTTGTIRLKATFTNPQNRLWPGQFVSALLTLKEQSGVAVPSQALQRGQGGDFVFVVKPDMTAESRPVVGGISAHGVTLIEKGVQAGEKVVTDGQVRLVAGSKVQLVSAVERQGKQEARP